MATVKVSLTKIIAHAFPTFGEFVFSDTSGEIIVIHEKLPVMGVDDQDLEAGLPFELALECKIISTSHGEVLIDIGAPYSVQDLEGRTRFHVSIDLVAI